jgi:AmmeMemoRadiSam system protein B
LGKPKDVTIRKAAVAGTWYPGSSGALTREIDQYLERADAPLAGRVQGIIAPHAGIMFSGPVAAWSYKAAAGNQYDVLFLVGPSHFVGFDGFAVWPRGAFDSPLGAASVDEAAAAAVLHAPLAQDLPAAHGREHSLEMQLPFVRRVFPDAPIVPIVIGYQTAATIAALAEALVTAAQGRRALLVASSDLSHYFDASTAAALDGRVQAFVDAFDVDGLRALFERYPEAERGRCVACGGGAAIAVMSAARALGARQGRVLKYSHSGEVSGDDTAVVGYLAAAFGTFDDVE